MNLYKISYASPLLTRFALILFVIWPITFAIRWVAITVGIIMALSFILSFISTYSMCRVNKAEGLRNFVGVPRDRAYDCMISIAGLIVYLVLGLGILSLVWALVIFTSLLDLRKAKKDGLFK